MATAAPIIQATRATWISEKAGDPELTTTPAAGPQRMLW
jgi:hypothetical protein